MGAFKEFLNEERMYNLVFVNDKTKEKTKCNSSPLTHKEAVTMKSKQSDNSKRYGRFTLEEI